MYILQTTNCFPLSPLPLSHQLLYPHSTHYFTIHSSRSRQIPTNRKKESFNHLTGHSDTLTFSPPPPPPPPPLLISRLYPSTYIVKFTYPISTPFFTISSISNQSEVKSLNKQKPIHRMRHESPLRFGLPPELAASLRAEKVFKSIILGKFIAIRPQRTPPNAVRKCFPS